MGRTVKTDLGNIVISDEVIATIAGMAASECYGVVGMAARRLQDGLAELLGREHLGRGVQVAMKGDNVADINLYVIVGYGVRITEVARNVVQQVRYAVEQACGITVRDVSIHVQGVKVYER